MKYIRKEPVRPVPDCPNDFLFTKNTGWLLKTMRSCKLSDMGFKVLVGNSRKLRAIWASERKSDKRDAEMLARIARFDIYSVHLVQTANFANLERNLQLEEERLLKRKQ